MANDWINQVGQILGVYVVAYYALRGIDRNISNVVQNLSLRITLSMLCSFYIYHTYPASLTRLDSAIITHCGYVFFSTLRLNVLVIYDDKITRQKRSLFDFIFEFLWLVYPISKEHKSELHLKLSFSNIIHMILTDLVPAVALSAVTFFVSLYFLMYCEVCLNDKHKVNMIADHYLHLVWYSLMYTFMLKATYCCIFTTTQSLVRVMTLNRYKFSEFSNYPLFSVSVREIWSKRFNYFVRSVLHQNVFMPLRESGYSATFAAFMAFFMSGVLHVYITWKQFGTGLVSTQWFFVLHGIITVCEGYVYGKRKRHELSMMEFMVRICITNVVFAMTLPFYIGLFVMQYPKIGQLTHEMYKDTFENEHVVMLMSYIPTMQCVYP
eukprot:360069_1